MKKALMFVISLFLFANLNAQYSSRLYLEQHRTVTVAKNAAAQSPAPAPFQDLNGMLNFASDYKGLSVVPTVNLWATQMISENRGKISFDAFVGINKYDSLLYNSALKLFLPEASQYGFSFKGQHLISKHSDIFKMNNSAVYFNWQANVLGKSFVYTDPANEDKSDESSMTFHPKLGLDWVAAKGVVNFYGNFNALARLTNVARFDSTFKNTKDFNYFFDIGFGVTLNLDKNDTPKNTVYLQLGGILKGLNANKFLKTDDMLVPVFKITLLSTITTIKPASARTDAAKAKLTITNN